MDNILPIDVSDANMIFGGDINKLLPAYEDIPSDFKNECGGQKKWLKIVSDWFFEGLPKDTVFTAKEGIDKDKALKHVASIIRSYRPSHEHKTAGCAYLLSLWFDDISYTLKAKNG